MLERAKVQGLQGALGYPRNPPEPAAWAQRSHRAHLNLVENLPAFAALVIIAHLTEVDAGAGAAMFFYARLVHAVVYTLGIAYIRTLSFVVSWIGMLIIFFSVL